LLIEPQSVCCGSHYSRGSGRSTIALALNTVTNDPCTRWTSYSMRPEPLIQKLFAIERAIGHTSPAALRAMVIDAQETALRLDLDNLHNIESIRRSAEKRQLANLRQFVNPDDDSDFPWSA